MQASAPRAEGGASEQDAEHANSQCGAELVGAIPGDGRRRGEAGRSGDVERQARRVRLKGRERRKSRTQRFAYLFDEQRQAEPDGAEGDARAGRDGECEQAHEIVVRTRAGKDFSRSAFDRRLVDEVLHAPPRWLISR